MCSPKYRFAQIWVWYYFEHYNKAVLNKHAGIDLKGGFCYALSLMWMLDRNTMDAAIEDIDQGVSEDEAEKNAASGGQTHQATASKSTHLKEAIKNHTKLFEETYDIFETYCNTYAQVAGNNPDARCNEDVILAVDKAILSHCKADDMKATTKGLEVRDLKQTDRFIGDKALVKIVYLDANGNDDSHTMAYKAHGSSEKLFFDPNFGVYDITGEKAFSEFFQKYWCDIQTKEKLKGLKKVIITSYSASEECGCCRI